MHRGVYAGCPSEVRGRVSSVALDVDVDARANAAMLLQQGKETGPPRSKSRRIAAEPGHPSDVANRLGKRSSCLMWAMQHGDAEAQYCGHVGRGTWS